MLEIVVPGKYSQAEMQLADLKRVEFRRNRYTSGCAHLDDLITLGKAVILCDTHVRKFNAKAARYRAHPAKHMRRVQGNCDVCRQFGFASLFLNEKDALDEQRKTEKYLRNIEYARVVNS